MLSEGLGPVRGLHFATKQSLCGHSRELRPLPGPSASFRGTSRPVPAVPLRQVAVWVLSRARGPSLGWSFPVPSATSVVSRALCAVGRAAPLHLPMCLFIRYAWRPASSWQRVTFGSGQGCWIPGEVGRSCPFDSGLTSCTSLRGLKTRVASQVSFTCSSRLTPALRTFLTAPTVSAPPTSAPVYARATVP